MDEPEESIVGLDGRSIDGGPDRSINRSIDVIDQTITSLLINNQHAHTHTTLLPQPQSHPSQGGGSRTAQAQHKQGFYHQAARPTADARAPPPAQAVSDRHHRRHRHAVGRTPPPPPWRGGGGGGACALGGRLGPPGVPPPATGVCVCVFVWTRLPLLWASRSGLTGSLSLTCTPPKCIYPNPGHHRLPILRPLPPRPLPPPAAAAAAPPQQAAAGAARAPRAWMVLVAPAAAAHGGGGGDGGAGE